MTREYFLGIDIGTQGVRAVLADIDGFVAATAAHSFASINSAAEPGFREQRPEDWWSAAKAAIADVVGEAAAKGFASSSIAAVSVDGTSGTVVPLGRDDRPLADGVMYNDARGQPFLAEIRDAAKGFEKKYGLGFNASFALPSIVWFMRERPELYEKTRTFAHQVDYIVGKLGGNFRVSDASNALKTGYDPLAKQWAGFMSADLGVDTAKLPDIVPPGTKIAAVSKAAAAETGLAENTPIIAGATDGYASMLASGSARPGDWTTVIGTTLVVKGVTADLRVDPEGRIYSHYHPENWWLPGGASNCGGLFLNAAFAPDRFDGLNAKAAGLAPTGILIYPLPVKGERFPFVDPEAESFTVGDIADPARHFLGIMESVGYAERLSFELLQSLGCEIGDSIYSAGGACRSDLWLKTRASILDRVIKIPATVDAAMGAAMLAASGHAGIPLSRAVAGMTVIDKVVEPDAEKTRIYGDFYHAFKKECARRFAFTPA